MDSKLEVESALGKGSRFYFTLDVKKCTKTNELAIPKRGLKFLVAEDIEINRMLLETIFSSTDVELTFISTQSELRKKVEKDSYDMIFIDINIPELDALETLKEVRKTEVTIPIIALSSSTFEEGKEKFLEIGIDDCLHKPFVMDEINRILAKWIL